MILKAYMDNTFRKSSIQYNPDTTTVYIKGGGLTDNGYIASMDIITYDLNKEVVFRISRIKDGFSSIIDKVIENTDELDKMLQR